MAAVAAVEAVEAVTAVTAAGRGRRFLGRLVPLRHRHQQHQRMDPKEHCYGTEKEHGWADHRRMMVRWTCIAERIP